jgi:hypothetical protein
MARLHHVSRELLARAGRGPEPGPAPTWRPGRPRGAVGVEPWFQLTPDAPSADTRVGAGLGVVATLETFGGITGPTLHGLDPDADPPPVVLGGAAMPPGSAPPDRAIDFARGCAIRIVLRAADLGRDRQGLIVVGLRGETPPRHAIVQSFVGLAPVAEDAVTGEDRLAFALDAGAGGGLSVDLVLRLCGADPGVRLGVRGVVGYLL